VTNKIKFVLRESIIAKPMKILKTTTLMILMGSFFLMSSCKKKTENQKNIIATWNIVEFQSSDMDSVALAAINQGNNSLEFSKKGVLTLTMNGDAQAGTYTTDENVTQITTVMDGKSSTYQISNFTENSMTITSGNDMMKLSK